MRSSLYHCASPAKLNLFLHVTGRRADGYHLLQTVFQLLDQGDVLHFDLRKDGLIRRTTNLEGVPEETDLIIRAASLLKATAVHSGKDISHLGADISIEKLLPIGGGLGGGSSDAATTLIALNYLWNTQLTRRELMKLSLQLGADVPFFLFGKNAFAEGIGEALSPITTPNCWYVIIEPGVSVPTASIFSSTELTRDSKPVRITDFRDALIGFGKNDLQDVAVTLFPAIAEALKWLGNFGEARMTGSGACVFCAFMQEQYADQALQSTINMSRSSWKVWKAKALECHPLSHLLES